VLAQSVNHVTLDTSPLPYEKSEMVADISYR